MKIKDKEVEKIWMTPDRGLLFRLIDGEYFMMNKNIEYEFITPEGNFGIEELINHIRERKINEILK